MSLSAMLDAMAEVDPDEGANTRRAGRPFIAVGITVAAVVAGVVHLIEPGLKIDSVTLVLLGVAIVPWLGGILESIELPGGMKLQLRRLTDRIDAVDQRATHIGQVAEGASRTARVAFVTAGGSDTEETSDAAIMEMVERLAADYVRVRAEKASSGQRTYLMEMIFADLVAATRRVREFDVDTALASEDPGIRLAAYARMYALPDRTRLMELVDFVTEEGLAFSQYWGFHAVGALVDEMGADQVPVGIVRRLRTCLSGLPSGSDRIRALQSVLAKFDVG